ncbi:hypothetical protein [Escherichia coli]|uniref:hypothetical protein n=1 Tax=Escherichia coli TaxID=562 RepID=UPI00158968E6|nr:hypothetical protein [Escherichia coli]
MKIAEEMKKTPPDGGVSCVPASRETGRGKTVRALTISAQITSGYVSFVINLKLSI